MGDSAQWDPAGGNAGGAGQQKAPPKQVRRIGAKPPPDRAPRSIYCITLKNPLRKLCLEVGLYLNLSFTIAIMFQWLPHFKIQFC